MKDVERRESASGGVQVAKTMPGYFAVLTIVLMLGMVLARVVMLKRKGIAAMKFGRIDRTDFLIPPFAFFYFYLVFAAAFHWPTVSTQEFFPYPTIAWVGVAFCLAGLCVLSWALVSFGRSFRVGIDADHPDRLTTTGIFAYSRNPIYVAFGSILIGQFLIFSNWILLVYLGAGVWLLHRQVLREEAFLERHYGQDYVAYRRRVRRYF